MPRIALPRWIPRWLFSTATGWVILANVFVYLAMIVLSRGRGLFSPFPGSLTYALGAMVPEVVPAEPWRLVTATFLHAGFFHIAMNMAFFYWFGSQLERGLGRGRFLVAYMVCGLGGSLVTFGWNFFYGGASSVGASGAIMGVIGVLTSIAWVGLGRHHPLTSSFLKFALIGFGLGIVMNLLGMDMADNAAHIGGWATGMGVGYLFAGRKPWPKTLDRLAIAGMAAVVAGSFAMTIFHPGTAGARPIVARPTDRDAAQEALDAKDWARAEPELAKLIADSPDELRLRLIHAEVLQNLDRTAEAKKELLAAADTDGTPAELGALADELEHMGELAAARKAAARAHVGDPGNPRWKRLYDEIKAREQAPASGSGSGSTPTTASTAAPEAQATGTAAPSSSPH